MQHFVSLSSTNFSCCNYFCKCSKSLKVIFTLYWDPIPHHSVFRLTKKSPLITYSNYIGIGQLKYPLITYSSSLYFFLRNGEDFHFIYTWCISVTSA
jgi:hypothetical protein